jgi:hypothetical protein
MAKLKVAPAPPAPQESAGRTVPLDDVRIIWSRPRHYWGEPDEVKLEIPGAQLGQILAWLSVTKPGLLGKADKTGKPEELWPRGEVALELEGLSGLVHSLTMTERDELNDTMPAILQSLRDHLADLAGQLWALEEAPEHLKQATVTIGGPAAEAK